jgi:hypothetical protein
MEPEFQLEQLQRWFLQAVVDSAHTTDSVEELILPSRQQSANERLTVYQNAYRARLLEVFRELFPCTRFSVGDDLFDRLASGYLQAHPPRSYTLARLAVHWVEYLDATRPSDWGAFVVELARLEQAIDRVFDAPGPENLPPFVMPAGASAAVKLTLVPGCELHAFTYPVSTYFTAWKEGRAADWPPVGAEFVVLLRRDYIVRRFALTKPQYVLLSALQGGMSLGDAISRTVAVGGSDDDQLAFDVNNWFATWASQRFFAAAT